MYPERMVRQQKTTEEVPLFLRQGTGSELIFRKTEASLGIQCSKKRNDAKTRATKQLNTCH